MKTKFKTALTVGAIFVGGFVIGKAAGAEKMTKAFGEWLEKNEQRIPSVVYTVSLLGRDKIDIFFKEGQ
jgi:hypothetical protein